MRKISKFMLGFIALCCVSSVVLFEGCSKKEENSASYPGYPALDNSKLANKIWEIKTEPDIEVNVNYAQYKDDIRKVQDTLKKLFNTNLDYKFKSGKFEVGKYFDTLIIIDKDTTVKITVGSHTVDTTIHIHKEIDTAFYYKGGELPYNLRADQRFVLDNMIFLWGGMKSDDEIVLTAQMTEIRELVRAALKVQTNYTDELIDNTILKFITGKANIVLTKKSTKPIPW
ncbi:MAG: hypothetical protein LBD35_03500 [Prevotellaceae bacterium]|nr:hypothetical protein [Prevotellaceae bacterium]